MAPPTLFLSHSGPDKAAAIDLRRRLLASPDAQAAGLKVWLDVDDLEEGKPWQPQLEAAIGAASAFTVIVGSHGIRNWVRAETDLALSRAIKDESFRIIPILQDGGSEHLTPFVKRYHAVRDPLNDPDALQRLLRAALGLNKDGLPVLTEAPFPGLRSMSEDWADRFFGRRTETDEVLAMLRRHRAVTIVSDSGAGKSSLAMAGVGHAWRGGALRTDRPHTDDTAIWHVVTMRPAENPIEQLRDAIEAAAKQLGNDQAAISTYREKLTTDPAFAIRWGLDPAATTTLLIIDQAEELVTLPPRDRRLEFGRLIAALADTMGDRLRILITLRSDHLNLVTGVEGLGPMIRAPEAQFNLKQPVDLAEIVRGPLTLTGHRDEEEQKTLIGLLRNDLSDRPGHLALAQMTLSLAWRDRGKHGGLLGAYAANGGARAALGNEAERIEGLLSQEDTAQLMPIFIRLIRLSEIDTGATRRIAARDEFDKNQNRLIDQLAGEEFGRLVQTSAAHVEIAHEALITQWPRLHEYLIAHAGELRTLSDLMRRAQDWAAAIESAKHLTSLADEERFQALRQAHGAWLAPVERRLLDWSKAEHQRIIQEREEDAIEKGLALAGREQAISASKRAILLGVLATTALLFLLLGAGWFAYDRNKKAAQSRVDALALLALSQAETNPVNALALVLGAWPETDAGPFPSQTIAFRAINLALANTRPHSVLNEQQGTIDSIAFSPDGSRIVSTDDKGTLYFWDAATGAQLGIHKYARLSRINSIAFSPDGRKIVNGGDDGLVGLFNASTGAPLGAPLRGHKGAVEGVAFSRDGSRIVSGGEDGTVRLWNANTGNSVGMPLSGHEDKVTSVAFSPDGGRVVSGSWDGTLRLWNANTGTPIGAPLQAGTGKVLSVAFSPDGDRIVSSKGFDGSVRLWDGATGAPLGEPMLGHQRGALIVAFSPDGSQIVSGGGDGTLRLWDGRTGAALTGPFRGQFELDKLFGDRLVGIKTVAWSPDGARIASAGYDGRLRIWDATTALPLGDPLVAGGDGIWSVAFSPDGRHIVSGGENGALSLWTIDTSEALRVPLLGHERRVWSVAFSPSGSRIVSGGEDGTLRLWDGATGAPQGEPLRGHIDAVHGVAFSPDGGQIVSVGQDDTLRLWDSSTGLAQGIPIRIEGGWHFSVAFSPNRNLIASSPTFIGSLALWDVSTGAFAFGSEPQRAHQGRIWSLAFSPKGSRIVSGGSNGTLRLWDASVYAPIGEPLVGHDGDINSVAFSLDGARIVSGGDDGTVRLWDAYSGAELNEPMRGHEGAVRGVAFSADGKRIVSGGADGTLRLWSNLPPGNILQVACRYLPHINGRPDTSTDGLVAEIGIEGLTLPEDCDTYDPPLPPEFRQ